MLAYLIRKLVDASKALMLPEDERDDWMAVADAAGVTFDPELLAAHQAICAHVQAKAAVRQRQVGQSDFAVWTHELAGRLLTAPAPVDTVICDECGTHTTDPETCDHGREQCPECRESLGFGCKACAREALED